MRWTVKMPAFEVASFVMTGWWGRTPVWAARPPPRPPPASCVCGSCGGGGSCAYTDAPASPPAHNGRANLTNCFFIQNPPGELRLYHGRLNPNADHARLPTTGPVPGVHGDGRVHAGAGHRRQFRG